MSNARLGDDWGVQRAGDAARLSTHLPRVLEILVAESSPTDRYLSSRLL